MGLFIVMFMGLLGNKLALIFALPFVFITLLFFIFDRYHLFMIIMLLRPSLDPILEKTKMGGFRCWRIIECTGYNYCVYDNMPEKLPVKGVCVEGLDAAFEYFIGRRLQGTRNYPSY